MAALFPSELPELVGNDERLARVLTQTPKSHEELALF